LRSAHAFDASFFFTVNAQVKLADAQSDTLRADDAQGALAAPSNRFALFRSRRPTVAAAFSITPTPI